VHAWAVLVGVSAYPSLPPERQLTGPGNDVRLMRDVLKQLRSDWRAITVLADGVEAADGLPTRAAVLGALDDLIRKVGPRDEVVIYFSGHGSQQPTDDPTEDDGLDEIFLPRDIGRWNGSRGTVANAIVDDEINARLTPLLKKGAHVWAIFDTCHSGTMTRGTGGSLLASQETARWVPPAELGIPAREPGTYGASTGAVTRGRPAKVTVAATVPTTAAVVFEASRSFETTPEMRLPAGDPARVPHGLFTYELVQALAVTGLTSYQQLADTLRTRYASLNRVAPTPQFEGPLGNALPVLNVATRPDNLPAGGPLRVFGPRLCAAGMDAPPCDRARTAPDDDRTLARVERLLGSAALTGAVSLERVTRAEDADVAVFVHEGRIWFVAPGDDYALDGRLPPSFAASEVADAGPQLARFLAAMATAHYLYGLGETQRMFPGLSWNVGSCTPKGAAIEWFTGHLPVLNAGQSVCIEIANAGPEAADLTLLHVGEDFGIEALFPLRAESNRIPAGARRRIVLEVSSQGSRSLDRVLAIAAPARADAEHTDFSWAAQPGLPRFATRGTPSARPMWVRSFQWISAPASP
jgi:Caspase domain